MQFLPKVMKASKTDQSEAKQIHTPLFSFSSSSKKYPDNKVKDL